MTTQEEKARAFEKYQRKQEAGRNRGKPLTLSPQEKEYLRQKALEARRKALEYARSRIRSYREGIRKSVASGHVKRQITFPSRRPIRRRRRRQSYNDYNPMGLSEAWSMAGY